jgi:putative two-component system response regulator
MSEPGETADRRVDRPLLQDRKASLSRPRVLIGEDDGAFRSLLLWTFEDAGYEVSLVENGSKLMEAVAESLTRTAKTKKIDLIVCEVAMPGWNGLPAIEGLCASPLTPPIVVMSSMGSTQARAKVRRAGAAAFFEKPFDMGELMEASREALAAGRG